MKVEDVMTSDVKSCRPDINLAAVGAMMWEYDIGALPVVDDLGKAMGTFKAICEHLPLKAAASA